MKISVIIPTYNRAHMIKKSIDSALKQIGQGEEFEISEIIVVDDCSLDDTKSVMNEIVQRSEKVKYYCLKKNGGPSAARNYGVKMARGEWIALLDSDDEWHTDKLKEQSLYAKEHPEYDMLYHTIKITGVDEQVYLVPLENEKREYLEGDIHVPLLYKNFIGAPSMLIRKETWLEIGGYDESMRYCEDWEFALRVSETHKIGFVDKVLMDSQMQAGGLSAQDGGILSGQCYIAGKYKNELLKYEMFNDVVGRILNAAKERNILAEVGILLEKCLQM